MLPVKRAVNCFMPRLRPPTLLIALAAMLLAAPIAAAHPLSQGVLQIEVKADKITVQARITTEEVQFTNGHTGEYPIPPSFTDADSFRRHAEYLASHLHFTADGQALAGSVVVVTPPDDMSNTKTSSALYDLEYRFTPSTHRTIGLYQDTLADAHFAPGESWEAVYFFTINQSGQILPPVQGILNRNAPITMVCNWGNDSGAPAGVGDQPAGEQPASTGKWGLFKTYCVLGVFHILGQPSEGKGIFSREDVGFDHLLFVTALVLSTRSLWDLFKVVSAFTLAHTITLTLAALKIVNISPHISEPLISLSIVFVALQNVFWPQIAALFGRTTGAASVDMPRAQSKRSLQAISILAAAFFFGLFHGLGFAGGLLETMRGMHGATVAVAITGFSLGVELGHQMVVLPLFGLLALLRQIPASELSRERLSFHIQRIGSIGIALAGSFYLVIALEETFSRWGAIAIVGGMGLVVTMVMVPIVLLTAGVTGVSSPAIPPQESGFPVIPGAIAAAQPPSAANTNGGAGLAGHKELP